MEAEPGHRAEAEGDGRALHPSHRYRGQDHARPACRGRRRLGSHGSGTGHALGHELVAGNGTTPACRIDAAVTQAMAAAAHARAARWCRCRTGSAEGFEGEHVGGITALLPLAEEDEGGTEVATGERVLEDGEGHALEQRQTLACRQLR
jgi:hypothetical protein